ncbi:MAG: mycothiol synthase [Actinomycetota bacterium]|nr:mycothiol synthase [Actinomycetota bacterium]
MTQLDAAVSIVVLGSVDEVVREAVLALEADARAADGAEPLNDQVRLDLQYADTSTVHLVARRSTDGIIGYAHLRHTEVGISSAHLVVAPAHRRQGVGKALVERLIRESGPGGLRVWAHGDEAAARFLSGRLGFTRVRELCQLQRSLAEPLPDPSYPDDVGLRTFELGRDEAAWLDVNARAFAHHPEQGDTDRDDLEQRMSQPWFDPAGFFLAERGGRLLGFHWTKVHSLPDEGTSGIGEVYVVGVDPAAQGLGLGKALTLTGLHYLRALGLDSCILYVERDNASAVAVYEKLGFTTSSVDVLYERP